MGIERLNEFWPEWRIESELGEGAFGKVYKAVDEEAGFPVYSAIKVLSIPSSKAELDALESEGMTESESKSYFKGIADDFVNEIKLMHALKGAPNIVGVEQFKIAEKQNTIGWDIFIRMELLTSFKDYLKKHTPTEEEIVKLGIDIATALEICQKENIIHRDIKPANIFVDKYGSFKLGDFGIAKELEKTTGAVSSKGTFSYMAPEVARGQRYDNTVDIYSLGLVMYSLLNNNRPPFVDPHKTDISYNDRKNANDRRLAGEPLSAPCNASLVLSDIILTACAYDPSRRFMTATAFKNALLNYKDIPKAAKVIPPKPVANKPSIDETVAVARKPESKPKIDETVAVSHKPAVVPNTVHNAETDKQEIEAYDKKKKREGITALIVVIALLALIVLSISFAGIFNDKNDDDGAVKKRPMGTTVMSAPETGIAIGQDHDVPSDVTFIPDSPTAVYGAETITFGAYEQDNDTSNGKEAIKWIVLAKEDGKALVTSKYALDCQPYNEEDTSVTWEKCTLREWLNNDFYNAAFSESEKTQIESTYVVNDDNAVYGTEGGKDTSDKIFLLSIDEAEEYFDSDEERECTPTDYADANGAYVNSDNGNCCWWIRSPGDTYDASYVYTDGGVSDSGLIVSNSDNAVRPALWINLE
ncbi:MAG: serine/threonine protein kinase [Ruminococcaceae bacterium]|nr:serine/threonine protein kinase [Oscillospiraceae bacterium]